MLDESLIPKAESGESKVFYHKMYVIYSQLWKENKKARSFSTANSFHRKGDYHRYLAEFASGEKRKVAATAAHEAYKVKSAVVYLIAPVVNRSLECYGCCADRAYPDSSHPSWSCPQFLRFLLRDSELSGPGMSPGQASF